MSKLLPNTQTNLMINISFSIIIIKQIIRIFFFYYYFHNIGIPTHQFSLLYYFVHDIKTIESERHYVFLYLIYENVFVCSELKLVRFPIFYFEVL